MSSRTSKERPSKRSGGDRGSQYPTMWTEWAWHESYKCDVRYRLTAPNVYEYDYGSQSMSIPRNTSDIVNAIPEQRDAPTASQGTHYTTDAVNVLASNLEGTSLVSSSSQQPQVQGYGPSTSTGIQAHITTQNPKTNHEKFDPHYRVHKGHEFQWGKVFKVLWAEPAGNNESSTGDTEYSVRNGKHGEKFHEKVRRFVIIDCREGHCICLPIMTYGGRGTNKMGVHAKDHAIIWTENPVRFKGEWERGLTRDPIRVDPFSKRHKLEEASRLNYAKLYTIEYNVKIWFIGMIHKNSQYQLTTNYNMVHPPMRPRGPPPSSEDTFAFAGGAAEAPYSSYPGSTAPYTSSNSTYPATSSDAYETSLANTSYRPHRTDDYRPPTLSYTNAQMAPTYPPAGYETPHAPLYRVDEDDPAPSTSYDREDYYDDK